MIQITRNEKIISVQSPYNPDLPGPARQLGGKWNPDGKSWSFDIRDESRVEELYRNIYGEWDSDIDTPDRVTARITAKEEIHVTRGGIYFGGRQVAGASGRDSGARLGGGVVCLSGAANSGGSAKNWATKIKEGSVFEVRDIPLTKTQEKQDEWTVEILGDVDTEQLLAEKERLLARVAEIDKLLTA